MVLECYRREIILNRCSLKISFLIPGKTNRTLKNKQNSEEFPSSYL